MAPVRLLIILLPIVEESEVVELELDVLAVGVVVEVEEVSGVVAVVVDAVVVGILLLLLLPLTLDTMILTSPEPLMTAPQADLSNFHAINIGRLTHPISTARVPIVAVDWPGLAWPWLLAEEFDHEPGQPLLGNSQHPEFGYGMHKYLCSYWSDYRP